jgi:ABC-type transport system substrate-binding protein
MAEWRRGQHLALERADGAPTSAPRRVLFRFAPDPDAALNLVLSGEADVMEAVGAPDRVARVERQGSFEAKRYPSAVYGFLAFRVNDAGGMPHPLLGDAGTRRALALAVDRPTMARAVFGTGAAAPPGPMSRLLWIWSTDSIAALPFDTAAAVRALDSLGWRAPAAGATARTRGGRPLRFDILVPSTSGTRRQLAQILQEAWRRVGAEATVTAVDFPVFQQRLAQGQFDSYIGAYLDEPSPRSLADQWSRSGWDALNHGRWASPGFDSLLAQAARTAAPAQALALYHEAMDTLNAQAPAIFLYTPENVAAVHSRLRDVVIDPYAWISRLPEWSIDPRRMLARDSVR